MLHGGGALRIAHVYKDVAPSVRGGIERYVRDTAAAAAAAGHEVSVLVASRRGRSAETPAPGVEVRESTCICRILSNPVCPSFARDILRLEADILHFHHPLPTAAAAWCAARPAAPHVVTYHSDIVRQAALVPLVAPFIWPFLRAAGAVLATSPAYVGTSAFLRRLRNVEVLPLGVDLDAFSPGGGRGDFFLFVGRFRSYKGIPVLLEAWRGMEGRRLLMVGSGPLSDYASRNAPRGVELLGEVGEERLLELYRSALCLVLPSTARSEAFGMVQLEAMACGTPVISTALPTGVPWVNRHGETGLVVPPGDPGAIASAARTMLDEATRERLAEGALARAGELSFERHMASLLEVYERVARGRD